MRKGRDDDVGFTIGECVTHDGVLDWLRNLFSQKGRNEKDEMKAMRR